MHRKNEPSQLRQGSGDVGSLKPTTSGTSPMRCANTACTATNSREFALNILSHIAELVKSDGFLIAVCGVWLCSMIAWWVL